mgnify:CR=1 FL=1
MLTNSESFFARRIKIHVFVTFWFRKSRRIHSLLLFATTFPTLINDSSITRKSINNLEVCKRNVNENKLKVNLLYSETSDVKFLHSTTKFRWYHAVAPRPVGTCNHLQPRAPPFNPIFAPTICKPVARHNHLPPLSWNHFAPTTSTYHDL